MENIIKKAIEGGWKPQHLGQAISLPNGHAIVGINFATDPSFWQALGKACGWKERFYEDGNWKDQALSFYKINLTAGWDAAVKWLEDLIQK